MNQTTALEVRPSLPRQVLYLIAGSFVFVLAKHISSAGEVTAWQLQFWALGLVPFALNYLYQALSDRLSKIEAPKLHLVEQTSNVIWTLSLLVFIFANQLHLAYRIQDHFDDLFGYKSTLSDIFFSLLYVIAAIIICLLGWIVWNKKVLISAIAKSLFPILILNAVVFFFFVFDSH